MNAHLARRAFSGRRILVGVCGGIAAYKLAALVSELTAAGAEVRVAMTPEATRFVGPLTFEALSGNPVACDLLGPQTGVSPRGGEMHIALSDWPEAILIAPATANFIAKLRAGLADEVVSATVLASAAPLVVAPAMHARMWQQDATRENVDVLRERGVSVVGPVEGRLASGEVGPGRLAPEDEILRALREALPGRRDLAGLTVLVSAGGTRESIDPVRFVSNRSSGRMGHAVAAAAEARGARVVLVTTSSLPEPAGVEVRHVESAAEMAEALQAELPSADVVVMAAAVADHRPARVSDVKLRKGELPAALELTENPDLLEGLRRGPGQRRLVRVGFAAETHDVIQHALEKLLAKDLDVIVANDVSDPSIGMGSPDNAVTILQRGGERTEVARAPKEDIADAVLDAALAVGRERQADAG